jgi:polyisoprenoid-binding protein YceI
MQTTQNPQAVATPQLGRYEIDTKRSTVTFRTRHLFGLAPVRGTFAIAAATVDVTEPPTDSRVRAEIETGSFRTRTRPRDAAVKSRRFLDVDRHPLMIFENERCQGNVITGTLTVRGVKRPVTLSVDRLEVAPGSFTARATTRIDRTEFGVTASRGLAGRYLDLVLDVRCVRP